MNINLAKIFHNHPDAEIGRLVDGGYVIEAMDTTGRPFCPSES